jgi:predicted RNA-binding protein YlqC (UPF0109 family)
VSELVRFLVRSIVRHPEDIEVSEVQGDASVLLELSVNADDMNIVRGPEDDTLRAIRTVLSAASGRRKVVLELLDPEDFEDDEDTEDDDGEDDNGDDSGDAAASG